MLCGAYISDLSTKFTSASDKTKIREVKRVCGSSEKILPLSIGSMGGKRKKNNHSQVQNRKKQNFLQQQYQKALLYIL